MREFRRYLVNQAKNGAWDRIDLVGHSFGTHIIAWALYGLPEPKRPRVNTIILAGSVLKSNFPWQTLLDRGVLRVVNDCGIHDAVLVLNQIGVLFTGIAGRIGFNGGIGDRFANRFFKWGHSGYFIKDRKPNDEFMQTYWIPLLTSDDPIKLPDDPRVSTVRTAILFAILRSAEPIRLIVYSAAVLTFVAWILGLYREADDGRGEALSRQSLFLADRGDDLAVTGNHASAMLLTLEGLLGIENARGKSSWARSVLEKILLPASPSVEQQQSSAWHSLDASLRDLRERRVYQGHESGIWAVDFHPGSDLFVTGSEDFSARIWGIQNPDFSIPLRGHGGRIWRVRFTKDGKYVGTASEDNTARIWETTAGTLVGSLEGHTRWVTGIDFSPVDQLIATSSEDGTVRLWTKAAPGADWSSEILANQSRTFRSVLFTADGAFLLAASEDKMVHLWDVRTRKLVRHFQGHQGVVNAVGVDNKSSRIVTASEDKTARVWDWNADKHLFALPHEGRVHSARFNEKGDRIVTTSDDKKVRIWDVATGKLLITLAGHDQIVFDAAFSPDARTIVTVSDDKTARIWDVSTIFETTLFAGHRGAVESGAFSPDGRYVVTVSWDETARLWDRFSGAEIRLLGSHTRKVRSVSAAAAGGLLVTGSDDKMAHIVSFADSSEILLEGHRDWITSVAFSPDGRKVATGSWDKSIRIWDAATGKMLLPLPDRARHVLSVNFSPDGRRLVTSAVDEPVRIWDVADGRFLQALQGRDMSVDSVVNNAVFSPNGKCVATAADDGAVRLWDAESGILIATLQRHKLRVRTVAFNHDGAYLVSASDDHTARVWQTRTGREIAIIGGHEGAILSANFHPAGSFILTTSDDLTARLWSFEERGRGTQDDPYALCSQNGRGEGRTPASQPGRSEALREAQKRVPRCLTPRQRQEYSLDPDPPSWCIETSKWPYNTQDWKDWLRYQMEGMKPPRPDSPRWIEWIKGKKPTG